MAGRQKKGAIAAGHEVTARAAAEMLREGGNAFDAAVAGVLAACVSETVLASVGGGGFLMAQAAETGRVRIYDFFAQTPQCRRASEDLDFHAIEADFGPVTQEFHIGTGATAVPGLVPGLFAVHRDLCRLPFDALAGPAIRAARQGVVMSDFQAYLFSVVAPILTATAGARALYAPQGHLLRGGERFCNPDFAHLLERLAVEGEALFRTGAVAEAIVAQSARHGGHLGPSDLRGYRVEGRDPLEIVCGETTLFLNPAPSAGGVLIGFGLRLLEALGLPEQALSPRLLAQVMARTNKARSNMLLAREGKPGHDLLSDAVLCAHLEALGSLRPVSRGTTHISVVDGQGNAAAVTISNGEGNGHVVDGFGFMLNNMLGEEDLNPQGFGRWPENTRLSSMMAPLLMRGPDGTLTALGSGGSNRIRTALLQVVVNLLWRGLDLDEAINAPRLHVEKNGRLSVEAISGPSGCLTRDDLAALKADFPDFHPWDERNLFFGGVHAARLKAGGRFEGAGDPRRNGVVMIVA